jgi:hypothetical protein
MIIKFIFPKVVFIVLAMLYTLVACDRGEQKLKRKPIQPKKTLNVVKDSVQAENWVIYRTPGTAEQMRMLKKYINSFNAKLVYGLKPIDTASVDESLVLGVLLSDLSYCQSFGRKKEAKVIFEKVKLFQNRLNIIDSSFYLLPKSKTSPTEVDFAAAMAYTNAILALREQNEWTELTKLKIGAWIQNMYVSLDARNNTKKKNELRDFLATQKIVTENLLYSLIEEGDDQEIDFFSDKLTLILEFYDELSIQTDSIIVEKKEGYYLLSGNRTTITNDEVYDKIAKVIDELRTEIGNYGKK